MLAFLSVFTTTLYVARMPASSIMVAGLLLYIVVAKLSSNNFRMLKLNFSEFLLIVSLMVLSLRILIKIPSLDQIELIYLIGFIVFLCYLFSIRESGNIKSVSKGIAISLILTLIICLTEIIFDIHMPTSRYSDVSNAASLWSYNKPTAFFYNENDMINAVACMMPFSFLYIKSQGFRLLLILSFVILSFIIASKAAIMTLMLYLIIYSVIVLKKKGIVGFKYRLLFVIFVPIAFFFSLKFGSEYYNLAIERFYGFYLSLIGQGVDGSTNERKEIYSATINFISSNPSVLLFGNGSFSDYNEYVKSVFSVRNGDFHNVFLEFITIGGLVSFLPMIMSYYYALKKLIMTDFEAKAYLVGIFLIYPIITSFGSSSVLRFPFLFLMIIFTCLICREVNEKHE